MVNYTILEKIIHQLRLVVYSIIYSVLQIPLGAGFLPSTVSYILSRSSGMKGPLSNVFGQFVVSCFGGEFNRQGVGNLGPKWLLASQD